jgi:hypothetical protein
LIAKLIGVVFADALLFLKAERPNLIALDKVAFQVTHSRVHEASAAFPGKGKQTHNRIPMQPCKAFCRANRTPFKQALNRLHCFGSSIRIVPKGANGLGVREGCRAGRTAVTLDFKASVTPKDDEIHGAIEQGQQPEHFFVFLAGSIEVSHRLPFTRR